MKRTTIKIARVLLIFTLSLIAAGLISNAMTENAFALSKPYNDIIKEGKKKKEEEKKKKEEEKKKKKEEEKKKKEEEEKHKDGDAQYRYLNPPIYFERNRNPFIKIQSVELLASGGMTGGQFHRNDRIDLKVTYSISDYDGFNNVDISWKVLDEKGWTVNSSSSTYPLSVGNYTTYVIPNVVNLRDIPGSSRFTVEVDVKLEFTQRQARITGYIQEPQGSVRIIDAYITSEDSYYQNYPGYPASFLHEGEEFYLVVEYEIIGDVRGDIDFDARLHSIWGYEIWQDHFWDKARSGWQIVTLHGWVPSFVIDSSSRYILEVVAEYNGKKSDIRSYYTVADSLDTLNGFNRSWDLGFQRKSFIEYVFISTDSEKWLVESVFHRGEPLFLIVNYRFPRDWSRNVNLTWKVYDLNGKTVHLGSKWFNQTGVGSFPVEITIPPEADFGFYKYSLRLGDDTDYDTYSGDFVIADETVINDMRERESAERKNIEFEFDENISFLLPVEWRGRFNYDGITPPLTFEPSDEISGMVLPYEFDKPEMIPYNPFDFFLDIESKATGPKEEVIYKIMRIGETKVDIAFYNGEVVTKGQYLVEAIKKVRIASLIVPVSNDTTNRIYVIRLVAPAESEMDIQNLIFDVALMVKLRDKSETDEVVEQPEKVTVRKNLNI
jgi:hypothetical protein